MLNIKNINAGLIIIKKINKKYYTLNNNTINKFPEGKYNIKDKTSLHTAIRNFINKIFNISISTSKINKIVNGIIRENLLSYIYIYIPNKVICYIATSKIIKYIYKKIYNKKFNILVSTISFISINNLLKNYNKINKLSKYILLKLKIIYNI